jgi:hypothetical protein
MTSSLSESRSAFRQRCSHVTETNGLTGWVHFHQIHGIVGKLARM